MIIDCVNIGFAEVELPPPSSPAAYKNRSQHPSPLHHHICYSG